MNLSFGKISLGGVRDENEIRGHRRTYIGAMPGKIINTLTKTNSDNALILLDEIDKLGSDYRGDPSSALLEVLDKDQNKEFVDHYLDMKYDLSKITFIATANDVSKIPHALRDRLDLIELHSYTMQEKISICNKHIIPKIFKNHPHANHVNITEDAISSIITKYTRESGVRDLERCIEKINRKISLKVLMNEFDKQESISITSQNLKDYLGMEKFSSDDFEKRDRVGVVNGLAYNGYGGSVLQIESVVIEHGKNKISCTGNLGKVMNESTQVAMNYIKSYHKDYSIDIEKLKTLDVHIHAPCGATPKDGPSAGIAITTCILSSLLNKKINHKIAMTGEVTIHGSVLPIGGLREKLSAAKREGIETVIIPAKNKKHLEEIPKEITEGLKIITCKEYKEVFDIVFGG